MNYKVCFSILALSFAGAGSALADSAPATVTRTVSALRSVEFTRSMVNPANLLKISYQSGGCNRSDNKVSYQLSVVSKKTVVSSPEDVKAGDISSRVTAEVNITVQETKPAVSCRMAYDMSDSVDVDELLKSQGKELGLDVTAPDTAFEVVFHVTNPVAGSTSVINFKL